MLGMIRIVRRGVERNVKKAKEEQQLCQQQIVARNLPRILYEEETPCASPHSRQPVNAKNLSLELPAKMN